MQELCDADLAVIALQSVIRGCAVNVRMAAGLALSAGLMVELRTTDPLWDESRAAARRRADLHRLAEHERQDVIGYVREKSKSTSISNRRRRNGMSATEMTHRCGMHARRPHAATGHVISVSTCGGDKGGGGSWVRAAAVGVRTFPPPDICLPVMVLEKEFTT